MLAVDYLQDSDRATIFFFSLLLVTNAHCGHQLARVLIRIRRREVTDRQTDREREREREKNDCSFSLVSSTGDVQCRERIDHHSQDERIGIDWVASADHPSGSVTRRTGYVSMSLRGVRLSFNQFLISL